MGLFSLIRPPHLGLSASRNAEARTSHVRTLSLLKRNSIMTNSTNLACIASLFLAACATTSPQSEGKVIHESLNALTQIVDPLYGTAVIACDATEQLVIERTDSTKEEDTADIIAIRQSCDSIFARFDRVRDLQIEARRTVERIEAGDDVPLSRAYDALNALQTASAEAHAAWQKAHNVLKELIQ